MVSDLPDAPVLLKICPYITYSNSTAFCKRELCHSADHNRFKEEGSCFLLVADEPVELPKSGDNAR